jgi:Domain of unknown function (DUF4041)/Protein of unknown function (DUF2510)/Meiotically up-regulated gene 113
MTAPGWYPDPQDGRALRWWDGQQWTAHTHPAVQQVLLSAQPGTPAPVQPEGMSESRSREATQLQGTIEKLRAEHDWWKQQIVETSSLALLQEVGIYQYRHRLQDAAAYKNRLDDTLERIRDMAKRDGAAVQSGMGWAINGSAAEGAKMVKDLSKLMLRSYNNEADNIVQTMRPYALDTAIKRLEKSRETVSKLGASLKIMITQDYHAMRVEELRLTADFLQKQEEEKEERKERLRQERERRADEEQARIEIEREQERFEKERAHYENLLIAARANADRTGIEKAEAKLVEIESASEDLEKRSANTRAGFVYVISNIGAFGEGVVKIGLTRRLDPMERVQELGGAAVPFGFDVHGFVFSDDAVDLELDLHGAFAHRRVNAINLRREFFRATPQEVREVLVKLDRAKNISFKYTEVPEALEYRQSLAAREKSAGEQKAWAP